MESVIRQFTVVVGDWMASDVADIRDLDELEVYGSEAQTSVQIASYVFEVWSVWHMFNKSTRRKEKKNVHLCVKNILP